MQKYKIYENFICMKIQLINLITTELEKIDFYFTAD